MSEIGPHKLTDALHPLKVEDDPKEMKPGATHATVAEQIREANESREAADSGPSNREHMVDIGRGNQQAGRQGQ